MVIKAYRANPFQYTYENSIFDDLFKELQKIWGESKERVLLLGNLKCEGREIDAVFIKKSSITIIDFKNYTEGSITFEENLAIEESRWFINDTHIRGGQHKNPFKQIKANKFSLKNFLEGIQENSQNNFILKADHISGLVLFHHPIEFDETKFSPNVRAWFHVVDFQQVGERLSQIASPQINLTNNDLNNIANEIGLPEYTPISSENSKIEYTYYAEINTNNPTAFLFAIDCSGSMSELINGSELSKSHLLSNVMNELFRELITKCSKAEGVKDYFHVGVIAYHTDHEQKTRIINPLPNQLKNNFLNPISLFEANTLRMDELQKTMKTSQGKTVAKSVKRPVWFDPICNGRTPMCSALKQAHNVLEEWCQNHAKSYPPLLIHITDGLSTDGDPEPIAQNIKQLATNDGQVLIFNINLSSHGGNELIFPSQKADLPNSAYAHQLFRMSSYLPQKMVAIGTDEQLNVSENSRCFAYNVSNINTLSKLLDIGTRVIA